MNSALQRKEYYERNREQVINQGGYTPDNVTTACRYCNVAKMDRSVDEFLAWAQDLVGHSQVVPE